MSIGGFKIRNKTETQFLTFAVVEWIDVFTRKEYRDVFLDSIRFCQEKKNLLLHAWCLMSNHVHLIGSSRQGNLNDILRDLKKYTSRQIIEAIERNERESRKDWMLSLFKREGFLNQRNSTNQFWRQDNHPVELFSPQMTWQRINYIHNNPVRAGIVEKPEYYRYSSAADYAAGKK